MSKASKARRREKRMADGITETDEERRARLREDPDVQALVGEALRNFRRQVEPVMRQRDGMASALAILVARMGGRAVLKPADLQVAAKWSLQFLPQPDGHLVMHVIRDAQDMHQAQLREKAASSGLVLP